MQSRPLQLHDRDWGQSGLPSWWRFQRRTDHDLTVIVPAYNEQQRLPASLVTLRDFLDDCRLNYRILVVDDGSSDLTSQCAEGISWRVATIGLPRQTGKGAAVRAGMLSATGGVLAFTDADLPYDLLSLRAGYERIRAGGCQAVFGARDVPGTTYQARRRLIRTAASWAFRLCMRWLVPGRVTDTQCGLKLFSREAAVEVFSRSVVDGFAFDAEVVFLCLRLGLACERIPVKLVNEYASTLSLTRHALPMLRDILQVRVRHWRGGYDLETRFAGPAVTAAVEEHPRRRVA